MRVNFASLLKDSFKKGLTKVDSWVARFKILVQRFDKKKKVHPFKT